MDERPLNESHDWTGQWWLPEDPENRVAGVLTFTPEDGLLLRLVGGWDYFITVPGANGSTLISADTKRWPVILGHADGEFLTLIHSGVVHAQSFNGPGLMGAPDKLTLRSQIALEGVHLDDLDEEAFTGARANIDELTVWSRRTGVTLRHMFRTDAGGVSGEIALTRLEPLVAVSGGLTAKLEHWSWQPFTEQSRGGNATRVREQTSIRLADDRPRSLAHWLDLLGGMVDLISLSTLKARGLIAAQVYLPPEPSNWPIDHPMREQPYSINVIQRRVVKAKPFNKALLVHDFVLTLDDLPFEQLMPRWLDVRTKFAAARSMILGLQYVSNGYVDTRVVTAVAAAESLHRALDPAPPIPPEEFRELRRTLLEAAPSDRRAWLADRLTEHANVPTLKQRLVDLAGRLGSVGQALVHDVEIWANAAKDARNSLAHQGGSGDQDLNYLNAITEVTSAVVIMNLLKELGVPQERLLRAVDEHPTLSNAALLARRVLCKDESAIISIAVMTQVKDDDAD